MAFDPQMHVVEGVQTPANDVDFVTDYDGSAPTTVKRFRAWETDRLGAGTQFLEGAYDPTTSTVDWTKAAAGIGNIGTLANRWDGGFFAALDVSGDITTAIPDNRVLFSNAGVIAGDSNLLWDGTSLIMGDATSPTVTVSGVAFTARQIIHDDDAGFNIGFALHKHTDTAGVSATQDFARSRGSEGAETVVQSGDLIGRLAFLGYDGTDFEPAAFIDAEVDGTPGNDDMPGRLKFYTTQDGAQVPTLALTLDNAQDATFAADVFGVNATFSGYARLGGSTDAVDPGDLSSADLFYDASDGSLLLDKSTARLGVGSLRDATDLHLAGTQSSTASFAFGLAIEGTYSSTVQHAYAMWIGATVKPGSGKTANGFFSGLEVDTGNGTIPDAYGAFIAPMTKTGANPVTAAYGVYISAQTIGSSNNQGLYQAGASMGNTLEGALSIEQWLRIGTPGHTMAGNDVAFGSATTSAVIYDDSGHSVVFIGDTPTFTITHSVAAAGTNMLRFSHRGTGSGQVKTALISDQVASFARGDLMLAVDIAADTGSVAVSDAKFKISGTGGDCRVLVSQTVGADAAPTNSATLDVQGSLGVGAHGITLSDNDYAVGLSGGTTAFLDESASQYDFEAAIGGNLGPTYRYYHNSSSPAADDVIARQLFDGETSTGATATYAKFDTVIDDETNGSMEGRVEVHAQVAGTLTQIVDFGASVDVKRALSLPIETISGATTLDTTHYMVLCDVSGGAFTVALPTSVGIEGRVYIIKKIDSSAFAVTVDGNGAETIDGATTQVISTQHNSFTIHSDNANWRIS